MKTKFYLAMVFIEALSVIAAIFFARQLHTWRDAPAEAFSGSPDAAIIYIKLHESTFLAIGIVIGIWIVTILNWAAIKSDGNNSDNDRHRLFSLLLVIFPLLSLAYLYQAYSW